jgi:YggT family protein
MFIIGNFIRALAEVIDIGLTLFMWIVIAHAILSWVRPDPFNPIVRFINQVTEPLLYQIRSRIPSAFGGIDFSPVIVLLGVVFLRVFLVDSLMRLSMMMF